MKDAEDNLTPEEYDRLFRSQNPQKSSNPNAQPNPNVQSNPNTQPVAGIQSKSFDRRNFLWLAAGVLGTAAVGGLCEISRNNTQKPTPTISAKKETVSALASPDPSPTISRPAASPTAELSPIAAPTVITIPADAPMTRKAEIILGQDYLGPEAIKKAFGITINPSEVPPIPFSQEDIEKAKELGEMLIFRTNKYSDGRPLTGLIMESVLGDLFFKNGKSSVFDEFSVKNGNKLIEGGRLYYDDAPRQGWALVTKAPLANSVARSRELNFLDQTERLVNYLVTKAFSPSSMPERYKDAISEYDSKIRELDKTYRDKKYNDAVTLATSLKANQLARPTFSEVCYDLLVYFQNNGIKLSPDSYAWTTTVAHSSVSSDTIVAAGHFTNKGIRFTSILFEGYLGGGNDKLATVTSRR